MSEATDRVKENPEYIGRLYADHKGNEFQLSIRAAQMFTDSNYKNDWTDRAISGFRERKAELGETITTVE